MITLWPEARSKSPMISLNTSWIAAADRSRISAARTGFGDPHSVRIASIATRAQTLTWATRRKTTTGKAGMDLLQAGASQDFFGKSHSTKPFNPARGLKCSAWAECLEEVGRLRSSPTCNISCRIGRKSTTNAANLAASDPTPPSSRQLHAVLLVVGQDFECRAGSGLQHLGGAGAPIGET